MKFKIKNALIGVAIYIYLLIALFGTNAAFGFIFIFYSLGCMFVANMMINQSRSRSSNNAIEFSQSNPASSLGVEYSSFHHIYDSKKAVNDSFRMALNKSVHEKLGCKEFRDIEFKDVDRDLKSPEIRTFFLTTAPETPRKTGFALLCKLEQQNDIQSVRWWIFVSGVLDPNKLFWRYALSPLTIPSVLLPYYRREYNPLSELMTIYPGFFNGIDVLNRTREIQFIAFETLVEVLNSFDVDTSDLKLQKGNILNINVSGGKANFGSVVQGAMNKVASAVGGGNS